MARSNNWTKLKQRLKTRWEHKTDPIHLAVSLLLLVGAAVPALFPSLRFLGWPVVFVIDANLFALLLLAARRRECFLPDRLTALFIVPIIFAALVLAFASVFLRCNCFDKHELSNDPKTAAVTVSTTTLPDTLEAIYVSLAVITTGATDYAPTDGTGLFAVAAETLSGLLLLLAGFPLLAARRALFKETASPTSAQDGTFVVSKTADGRWEVKATGMQTKQSDEASAVVEVNIRNGQIISVKKPG